VSRVRAAVAALLLVASVTGCGSQAQPSAGRDLSGTVTVLAAASLTETFTELARTFEAQHRHARVRLAFDSSATLAEQVAQGAPADVLATADQRTMRSAADAGALAGDPAVFATNRLVLVVPADNPAGIHDLTDIDAPEVDYVTCVPSAPCGALAAAVLQQNGITAPPASEEVDVKAVLTKVTLDEADAGLVYATDAVAAGAEARTVEIPGSVRAVNRYPIAPVEGAAEPDLAGAWIRLVTSDRGAAVLGAAGFGAP
jgi:molybdate transport system substrate-binding protein